MSTKKFTSGCPCRKVLITQVCAAPFMLQFKYEAVVVSVPYVGLGTRLGIAVYTLALLQSPSCIAK